MRLRIGLLTAIVAVVSGSVGVVSAGATVPQTVPSKVKRINALQNTKISINGLDDERVDVDVAVLDGGINLSNPDLNIVEGVDCMDVPCTTGPGDGDDQTSFPHGTAVAEVLAAIDNGIAAHSARGVGVAPGARIWSVDVVDETAVYGGIVTQGTNWETKKPWSSIQVDVEPLIAGVEWVTEHADEIEILHMAAGCTTNPGTAFPELICDGSKAEIAELEEAVEEAIEAGLVVVAPAGNWKREVDNPPARVDGAITVSAMFDSDGLPGAKGPVGAACNTFFAEPGKAATAEKDDTSATTTHFGAAVDITAPGPCTSIAAPHVSGAAAILASTRDLEDAGDVEEIGEILFGEGDCKEPAAVGEGSCAWTDNSDGTKEPLLDVGDKAVFDPAQVSPYLPLPATIEMPEVVRNPVTGQPCGELTINWPQVSGGCVIEGAAFTDEFNYMKSAPCGGGEISIGAIHVGSDGKFVATDVEAECKEFGAARCDMEPNEALYYFPDKKAKGVLHFPPWSGIYFREKATGTPYVYLPLCLRVTKAPDERKWTDAIIAKLHERSFGGVEWFEWEWTASPSNYWLGGNGFSTTTWYQADGISLEWAK